MDVTGRRPRMRHIPVIVLMPKSLRRELKQVASYKGLSLSELLTLAAERYIDAQKPAIEMIIWPETEVRN